MCAQAHLFKVLCAALLIPHGVSWCAKTEIEVDVFLGAFGTDLFEKFGREYEQAHPETAVTIYGHPRISEQLLPRFAAGTPPDLTWPGFQINQWELVFTGQLRPWDEYLSAPLHATGKPWRDTFLPALLKRGAYNGHQYILPYDSGAFGWWYNKKMFAAHEWKPPCTWEELLPLCEKIRVAGISPLIFTGRYPMYLLRGIYYPLVISGGGNELIDDIQGLKPGAWLNPACVRAAELIREMKARGYFEPGCIGMSHTESQMEFLVGNVAMIPNGTWLHSEMAKLLPPNFEMEFINPPVFAKGKGDPSTVLLWVNGKWILPAKGGHPDTGADFFRFMCDPARGKEFMEEKGAIMGFELPGDTKPPEHLKGAFQIVKAARHTWTYDIPEWYPSLSTELDQATRDLYNEVITPREFVERNEAAARSVRENPDIRKFKVE